MNVIAGTVVSGRVVPDQPAGLPDGTRVKIIIEDDDLVATPEVIAARLALMDQFEPGWLSTEDDATWRAALREQREQEKAQFFDDAEKQRGVWE